MSNEPGLETCLQRLTLRGYFLRDDRAAGLTGPPARWSLFRADDGGGMSREVVYAGATYLEAARMAEAATRGLPDLGAEVARLQAEHDHLLRKVAHGCTDMTCKLCDRGV